MTLLWSCLRRRECQDRRAECAAIVRATTPTSSAASSSSPCSSSPSSPTIPEAPHSTSKGSKLWQRFDKNASQTRSSCTADSIVEVKMYLAEPNIRRHDDPLRYWGDKQMIYPHLYTLAKKYLCTPTSSVPCERVFSKAGEILSKKRNRLSPKTHCLSLCQSLSPSQT
ncbi:zinc finger BED domain-containing protein 4-like [Synchiropus splendidus]|uniref:zinc finger BED domain-containing protein 4-like n=1 Tax=Synchiropus splendidus TaxID=270530 RepID=UPI00237E114E|nr:zinc finger BED domain-containing protein 4-like [Synchiropus splendidus]